VYQPILEQMSNSGPEFGGFIGVEGSMINSISYWLVTILFHKSLHIAMLYADPFNCIDDPCHLTWLLRDNSRTFLPYVHDTSCANGKIFEEIQAGDPMFKDCPYNFDKTSHFHLKWVEV